MRLVVFDLDGTLDRFRGADHRDGPRRSFASVGQAIPSDDAIRSISGITARDADGRSSRLAPTADRIDVILNAVPRDVPAEGWHRPRADIRGRTRCAGSLAGRPRNNPRGRHRQGPSPAPSTLLERHEIIGRFNSIQTPAHNRGKPDPADDRDGDGKAGIGREATVMIGDTVHDMKHGPHRRGQGARRCLGLSRGGRTRGCRRPRS